MKERENNSEMNAVGEVEVHATVPHIPSKTNGGEQGLLNRALWEVSTPLHHSNVSGVDSSIRFSVRTSFLLRTFVLEYTGIIPMNRSNLFRISLLF